jgi:hypothetical protein
VPSISALDKAKPSDGIDPEGKLFGGTRSRPVACKFARWTCGVSRSFPFDGIVCSNSPILGPPGLICSLISSG